MFLVKYIEYCYTNKLFQEIQMCCSKLFYKDEIALNVIREQKSNINNTLKKKQKH